jgi:pimeloyl-ACP methyl ester carboxylesterase
MRFPKSTNGRTLPACPAPIKLGFRTLARVLPSRTEQLAAWLFCHPRRTEARPDEQAVLDSGHRFVLQAGGHELSAWSWGDGPTVLLHHGWNGRAAHMAAFVRPLVAAGYSVVAYDAPAHGESDGHITAMPEMARIIREVAFRLGGLHAVVAHSLGGAALLYAIRRGLRVERAVLVASPSDLRGFIDLFGEHIGLPQRTREGMARQTAFWFEIDWPQMQVGYWAESPLPPLLVVHDRNDRVVPWEHGERIRSVCHGAQLITTEGLGHRRIRRDEEVVRRAVGFVTETPALPAADLTASVALA